MARMKAQQVHHEPAYLALYRSGELQRRTAGLHRFDTRGHARHV